MANRFHYTRYNQFARLPALVLLCTLACLPDRSQSGQWQPWAEEFYRENTACTVASIQRVESAPDIVKVYLAVEPGTASGLALSGQEERNNWFVLHCPSTFHPAWRQNSESFDVLISGELKPGQSYTLSCATFHQLKHNALSEPTALCLKNSKHCSAKKSFDKPSLTRTTKKAG